MLTSNSEKPRETINRLSQTSILNLSYFRRYHHFMHTACGIDIPLPFGSWVYCSSRCPLDRDHPLKLRFPFLAVFAVHLCNRFLDLIEQTKFHNWRVLESAGNSSRSLAMVDLLFFPANSGEVDITGLFKLQSAWSGLFTQGNKQVMTQRIKTHHPHTSQNHRWSEVPESVLLSKYALRGPVMVTSFSGTTRT